MKRTALAIIAMITSLSASAGCKELAAAIEDSQKNIATEIGDSVRDNSAPRETSRQLRISNELAAINANLLLMDRAHCPLPSSPIDATGSAWALNGRVCAIARAGRGPTDDPAPDCNHSNWKRSSPDAK